MKDMIYTFLLVLAGLGLLTYLLFGFRIVEDGKIMQKYLFGKPLRSKTSGLRYVLPFVMSYDLVDDKLLSITLEKEEILTKTNLPVEISLNVRFRVDEPYLFLKLDDPHRVVEDVTKSLLREDFVEKPLKAFTKDVKHTIQEISQGLDKKVKPYGMTIKDVNITDVALTKDVKNYLDRDEAEEEIDEAEEDSDFIL